MRWLGMYKAGFEDLWNALKRGETVLIEHPSDSMSCKGLYSLVQWARSKDYPVVIDDILDTLYIYKVNIELADLDSSSLNEALVIKEGGRLEVGNVVGHITLKESAIQWMEYERVARPIFENSEKLIINVVLGIEKLFMLADSKRELITNINNLLSWIGNKKRIAFYFVNLSLINAIEFGVLPLLEELASTIIKIEKIGNEIRAIITKSANDELNNLEIRL
ncbi:hypothetical protein E3E24_06845 [Thermococcus sp. LS2]|nr:hypothetical protein [Thermococcus sp. LS2]